MNLAWELSNLVSARPISSPLRGQSSGNRSYYVHVPLCHPRRRFEFKKQKHCFVGSLVGDKAPIYIGDPSHIQDETINYVHRGMQGAFIGKDGTFGHVGLLFASNLDDKSCVRMGARILDLAKV